MYEANACGATFKVYIISTLNTNFKRSKYLSEKELL